VPEYEATAWRGMLASAGTPDDVARRLSAVAVQATNQIEVKARFSGLGAEAAPRPGP